MKEYIEREALMGKQWECRTADIDGETYGDLRDIADLIAEFPAADVVSKGAYDQVAWERDVAIQQLREDYGVSLGEKKAADVVEVVRCGNCKFCVTHKAVPHCIKAFAQPEVEPMDFCSYGERKNNHEQTD